MIPSVAFHATSMAPCGTGNLPFAQASPSVNGATFHSRYPGVTAWTPRTCSLSSPVGPAAHAWQRLVLRPRAGPPAASNVSQKQPV
ncbi:unnamed protein product [Periconia digitata]|uniref:Uncharacterized protein n=1 Tax=Periconia digitata TaxID=1303443 RepID=A0A9W4U739_9PLEO|nr:unnamed protein product [Periconia digitata]